MFGNSRYFLKTLVPDDLLNDIPYNLKRIKRRAIAFWLTAGTSIVLSLGLFLFEKTAAAESVTLGSILCFVS